MKHIQMTPPNYPDYVILNCTHNGIWAVEHRDLASGAVIERIDFVNQEYWTAGMGATLVPFNEIGPKKAGELGALQRALNADLLTQSPNKIKASRANLLEEILPF